MGLEGGQAFPAMGLFYVLGVIYIFYKDEFLL